MNAERLGQSAELFSGTYDTSYFKHDFEKFQYCSHQIMKLQLDKKYFYGDEVLLDLYRNGDVVTAAYLQLTFSTPGITVVNSLGTYAIEYVQLEYDTHVIETLYGEYMEMEMDLHVAQGRQGALGQLIGKNRTTMNSTYSVKLPFDCFRKGFPVCALDKSPVLRFKFRSASAFAPSITTPLQLNAVLLVDYAFLPPMQKEYIQTHRLDYLVEQTHRATSVIPATGLSLANKTANVNMTSNVTIGLANSSYSFNVNVPYDYFSPGTSNVTIAATVTDTAPSLSNYTVLVNGSSVSTSGTASSSAATIIYTGTLPRGTTANVTVQWSSNVTMNILSCTFSGKYITNECNPWTVFTNFELPTKEIFYIVQNTTAAPYDYTYDGTWDQFASMRLSFNGQEVIPYSLGTPTFMRQLQGLENYTRTSDRYFYVYAFSLDPINENSIGSVNLSRITRQQHDFALRYPTSDRQLRMYTRVYNFMRIENGEAIIAHELKTSDILDKTPSARRLALAVTNLVTINPQQTTMGLTWTSPPNAISYSIVSSPATTTQITSNPSSYTFTGLSAGTSYTFTVTSISTGGSATSSAASTLSPGEWQAVTTGTSSAAGVYPMGMVSTSSNVYMLAWARNTNALVYNSDRSLFTTVVKTNAVDDGIVTKYDKATGRVIWVTRIGGSNYDNPYYIKIDASENVYVTGATASNPIIFYSTDGSSVSVSSAVGFLVKYNKDGIVQWATRTGGDLRKMDVEGSNVYVAGYFSSATMTAYDAPGTSSSIPILSRRTATDTVLIKYSSIGVAQWMTSIAGNPTQDYRQTLSVNSTGVYLGAYYKNSTITVYDAPGTTSSLAPLTVSSGNTAFVITKFDFSGTGVWTQMTTGNFTSTDFASPAFSTKDVSNSMYITHSRHPASGNIYVYDTSGSLVNTYSAANTWSYIMKYDQNGSVLWLNIVEARNGIVKPITIYNDNLVVSVLNPTSSSYTNDGSGTDWVLNLTYDLNGTIKSSKKITGTSVYSSCVLSDNNIAIQIDGTYIRIYDTNSNTVYKTVTNPTVGSNNMVVTASFGL